ILTSRGVSCRTIFDVISDILSVRISAGGAMKRPKFDGCQDRNQARLPQGESCHRGTHQRTLVWLLASALAVLGTAEVKSAPHHKSESSDKNAAAAEHHKPESPNRKKDNKTADPEHHKS